MEAFLQKTQTQQRAYAVPLILTIKQVMSQDAFTAKETKQYDGILDRLMAAVKEPSASHINIYVGMAFALAFIGYFLYNNL